MKAFRPLEGRRGDESIWMDPSSKLLQSKTFFHAKTSSKPFFCEPRMATMVEVFDDAVMEKHLFYR